MEYRYLGKTGLQVSCIGFGNMINWKPENEELDFQILKKAIDSGINFFDTAEMYGDGICEKALGNFLKRLNHPREQLVISTKLIKCANQGGNPVNRQYSNSRKHIIDGLNLSLQRLQLDYVDIVFSHAFDSETPLEEVCRGFNQLIEDGKTFYWGTSNWSSDAIIEAISICDRLGLIRPIAEQCHYNMLQRKNFEVTQSCLYDKFGYGTTIYSPLAGGVLTGKYNDAIPDQSRYQQGIDWVEKGMFNAYFYDPILPFISKVKNPKSMQILKDLGELAKELGHSQSQLALAWALRNKDVSTAIIGARNLEQLEDNIKALDLLKKFTPDLDARIEKILDNRPEQPMNYRTFAPFPSRR